jgi:hypothetical protein
MKRIISISLFFVVVMFSFNVFAQEVSWEIKQHSTDLETLKQEVTEYVNNGYVPLGITYDGNELYILYVEEPDLGMEAWLIEWYNNKDEIQKGITAKMNQGYMPTGITYSEDVLYVLYVKMTNSATAWQLVPSATNLKAVEKAIQPYVKQGYVPSGIAFYKNEYWTMLLLISNTTVKSWKIESYRVGTHTAQINANIEKGYLPWGLEYSGKDRIDILYVGF